MTLESARQTTRERLARREENFLAFAEKAVFSRPSSPYNFVLREAGIAPGDVRRIVLEDGLDSALSKMFDAGVSIAYEEFKGRQPIVRNGRVLETDAASFDNPLAEWGYEIRSSGTSGTPTSVKAGFAHLASTLPSLLLAQETNGTLGMPTILYRPGMPCTVAVNTALRHIVLGNPVRRWFSPVRIDESRSPLRFRVAGALTPLLVRLCGKPFPREEHVPFTEAVKVARAAAGLVAESGSCVVKCSVSAALIVSTEALQNDIDLTGVAFSGAGEPPSPAKVKGIHASGARYVTGYAMSESGKVGVGCGAGLDATDTHFMRDRLAVVQGMKELPGLSESVGVFHYTTLLASAPKVMINVSSDDFGILEERECGCPLGSLGLTQHIRQVRSVGKLTGRGITLVLSDIEWIIGEALPARFGGTPQDYQLVEQEDETGATQLHLLVSPSIHLADESEPAAVLLEGLLRGNPGAALQGAVMKSAQAVRVTRRQPQPSSRGKLPAFRTMAVS